MSHIFFEKNTNYIVAKTFNKDQFTIGASYAPESTQLELVFDPSEDYFEENTFNDEEEFEDDLDFDIDDEEFEDEFEDEEFDIEDLDLEDLDLDTEEEDDDGEDA